MTPIYITSAVLALSAIGWLKLADWAEKRGNTPAVWMFEGLAVAAIIFAVLVYVFGLAITKLPE